MTKTKWHTKVIYLFVALVLVLSFTLASVINVVKAVDDLADIVLVPSPIAYDVKGACQEFCVLNVSDDATIEWWLESGKELNPSDILDCEDPWVGQVFNPANHMNDKCIVIRATRMGDIHVKVKVTKDTDSITLHSEKKWGEIHHTTLDVDPVTPGVQHTKSVIIPPEMGEPYEETITDMVYATFLEVPEPVAAGGAIVNWWLFKDTEENQKFIDDLMDYLAAREGALDDNHWAAHGKYMADDFGGMQPNQYIYAYGVGPDGIPGTDDDRFANPAIFSWVESKPATPWYFWNVTEDSMAEEVRGRAQATLRVDPTALNPCEPEKIMIVVLVHYPGGGFDVDGNSLDYYNGENIIALEKGKKEFHKKKIVPPAQVKIPQVRWAGEKIVLEKDWGVSPGVRMYTVEGVDYLELRLYAAIYSLEEGSIGNLEPIGDIHGIYLVSPAGVQLFVDFASIGFTTEAQQVVVPLGGSVLSIDDLPELRGYSVTKCLLSTQQQGEADVNAILYEFVVLIAVDEFLLVDTWEVGPINDHGFVVYFLAFEDIVLADTDKGALIDITKEESLRVPTPDIDVNVAVQVRGWFTSDALPGTNRPAIVSDDGITYSHPAGRYVLPDDWPALAGYNYELRPNWDLMDQAHLDDIVSSPDANWDHAEEFGLYNNAVVTTDPPAKAEEPCIGPFNTLQPWSEEDTWIASATVPTSHPSYSGRNTVVPDGKLDWFDCPMPPALVIFNIVEGPTNASLSGLDKGDLEGYGYKLNAAGDKVYQSPFYMVEIPADPYIPPGYNWDSWGSGGPYDYWTDLQIDSIIADTEEDPVDVKDVEVYSDNHGIAAVTINALKEPGVVKITATAEYPYSPKKGKYPPITSDVIEATWGMPLEHLNPDFEASPREGKAPLKVTFTNLTTGGLLPYVKAEWDFDCDGAPDITLTGDEVMAEVTWTYNFPGIYMVCLTMTDSSEPPLVHTETKHGYITVSNVAWYGDWVDEDVITDEEILEAVYCWLTNTPHNDHILTDCDILWLVHCWLKGTITPYPCERK